MTQPCQHSMHLTLAISTVSTQKSNKYKSSLLIFQKSPSKKQIIQQIHSKSSTDFVHPQRRPKIVKKFKIIWICPRGTWIMGTLECQPGKEIPEKKNFYQYICWFSCFLSLLIPTSSINIINIFMSVLFDKQFPFNL